MTVPTLALHKPVVDQVGFIGFCVVEHEVRFEIVWDGRRALIGEVAELERTMPACTSIAANGSVLRWWRYSLVRRSGWPGCTGRTDAVPVSTRIYGFSPTHSTTARWDGAR